MASSFKIELLSDVDKLVKVNNLEEVTNPVFFVRDGVPTSDGLLSNEIFGISKEDRANTFAYIDLHDTFMHPLCYKIWCRMDKRIREIVHGTKTYIVNAKGDFEESEDGKNGIKFLKDNIDLIKIKSTDSEKRDMKIKFLKENKDRMFIKKMIVIPAYYRDVNTNNGYVGVGEINKLYTSLLVAVRSLKSASEYGLSMTSATKGRIQEILLQIYTWFGEEPKLSAKRGIIRRANLSKTADYSSRLVMTAPNLKVESLKDMDVDLDHTAVPLASVCANFYPQMIFGIRRFFENEFAGKTTYNYEDKDGKIIPIKVKDYQIEFSDDRIKKEMQRFMHGYSNRFIPIKIPNYDNKDINMRFKGRHMTAEEYAKHEPGNLPIVERDLTWCDVFYMAAVEAVKDKTILITRYPIDSYYNQFPTMVIVSSTKDTEPMVVNNVFYKNYPKISQEDIGKNTSNMFIDSLNLCNAHLKGIGGDYDGDMTSVKGVYSEEANKELKAYMNSKAYYVNLGGKNIKTLENEGIQSLYSLTKILPEDENKLTNPVF